jgi:hypothetical protein
MGHQLQLCAPAGRRPLGEGRPADHRVDHLQDEVVLALDVAVQRHGGDAECGPDPAHRQGGESFGVGDGDGGVHDAFAGESGVGVAGFAPGGRPGPGAGAVGGVHDGADAGDRPDKAFLAERGVDPGGGRDRDAPLAGDLPGRRYPVASAQVAGGDAGADVGDDPRVPRSGGVVHGASPSLPY